MRKITIMLFIAFATLANASTYYVDDAKSDDSGFGTSWATAKKTISAVVTLANGHAGADDVFIKAGTYNFISQLITDDNDSYYGGFVGTETTTGERVKSDLDVNGVIDPWEFTNVTLFSSTFNSGVGTGSAATNAFEFGTSAGTSTININGITFTHTVVSTTSGQRTIKLNHPLVMFENNIIKNCVYTSANFTTSGNGGTLATSFGTFKNCLVEKNTITTTSTVDKTTIPGLAFGKGGKLVGCVIRNNKMTIDFTTCGVLTASNISGLVLNSNGGSSTAPAASNVISFSNSLIYNNEGAYIPKSGGAAASSSGIISFTSNATGSDEMYNCVIANNKATSLNTSGLLVKRLTGQTHNIVNNVFWNNKNESNNVKNNIIVLSGGTVTFTNNIKNADGNDYTSFSATNVFDLGITNTSANPPSFKSPTSIVGYSAGGTVETSNWAILSSSYFVTKGVATSNTTDIAGTTFLTPRSVGAYECILAAPPTAVDATAGVALATVTFTAPATNGGSAILDYSVTPYVGAIAGTPVIGSASPISVTGLTNGTAYTFTITARNANGSGAASAATNTVTPFTVPDAPSAVIATAGNAEVSVAFTIPASDGGRGIIDYTVTPYAGAVESTPATGLASPITVTGLSNGTAYSFKVTARNVKGPSAASAPSNVVTPIAPNVSILDTESKTPADLGLTPASVVTIDNGGTLNINATTEVSTITVASGGKINVQAGKPLTVGTLTLTGGLDGSATALKLDASITATTVRLFKTIDNLKWYFMSFPYNVTVANITKSNGDPKPTLNGDAGDLFIKYYDGAQRATNGVGANWKHYLGAELIANQGYIIGLSGTQPEMTLSFPLTTGGTLNAEDASRNVSVSENAGALTNNSGWNLIGQPFLGKYLASNAIGAFDLYVYDGAIYTQVTKALADLNPFAAYFIQASHALAGSGITFDFSAGRHLAPSVTANDLMDEVQLDFTSATGSDYALLRMDNSLTTGYEIGQDLEKWIGTGTAKPQIYTTLGGLNYAFNALPMSNVQNLPIGIYTLNSGNTTIHAAASKAPSLSKLLLLDKQTGITTDLLVSDYSFSADAGTNNTRFAISAQRIATDNNLIDNGFGELSISIVKGKLSIVNINDNATVRVFDALGRMIVNKVSNSNIMEINLIQKGVYTVQLQNGTIISTRKIIL